VQYLEEGSKDKFARIAIDKGFELIRSSGKHNIWKHPSGAQITSPKSSSDWRAIKNFSSEIKNRLAKFTTPEAPKSSITDTVVKTLKKTKESPLSSAQRRVSSKELPTGTQTTFKDFMNKVKGVTNKPNELQQRMERGIIDTMKSWDFNTKKVEAEKILKQLRTEELNLDPVTIKRNLEAIRYGQRYAGKKPLEMVTTHVLSYLPKAKAIQPTPRMPGSAVTTIGIGAGMALSDVLKNVAQQRREEQKRKRESLIPSGNQPYGTGKVAQLKQR